MAKTMEIFKAVVLFLMLVPLIGAMSVEELNEKLELKNEKLEAELAALKEIVSAVQAQRKADIKDFTTRFALMEERLVAVVSDVKLNDTEELEARVSDLEESVADLEVDVVDIMDDIEDAETVNVLQDERINTLEAEIFDNENDIEELVDITTGLTTQVSSLELDVADLDQRVGNLESGGGGSGNVTDLEIRVETLEEVTSQLTDDVSALEDNDVTQDERISSIEEDVTSLDQRVEDLESGGGGGGNRTEYADSIFMAVLTSVVSSSQNPLIFDNDVINPGGYYSTETGWYTVPYDGIYQFFINLQADSLSDTVYFYLYVDGSAADSHGDAHLGDIYRSVTVLLELTAGQTVHVGMTRGAYGDTTYFRTYFGGYFITPN